jgi:hypothetical protein
VRFHPYHRSKEDEKISFPQKLTRLLTFVPEKQLTSQNKTSQNNNNTFRDQNEQKDTLTDETTEKDPKDAKDEEDFFNLTDTMNESYRQLFSVYESNDEEEENFKSHNESQKNNETVSSHVASFTLTTKTQNNPFVAAYAESQSTLPHDSTNSNEDFLTVPVNEDFENAFNQQKSKLLSVVFKHKKTRTTYHISLSLSNNLSSLYNNMYRCKLLCCEFSLFVFSYSKIFN